MKHTGNIHPDIGEKDKSGVLQYVNITMRTEKLQNCIDAEV